MKLDYLKTLQEVEKRKWLEEIIRKFPEHDFTYMPMLSDKNESDREIVINDFKNHFNPKNVNIYNKNKKYDGNFKNYFTTELHGYEKRGVKDEIIFIDPDKGFYQLDINGTPNDKSKFKLYLMMHHIEKLMHIPYGISENSLIVVYQSISNQVTMKQYNPSGRKQIENVEYGLKNYMTGKNYLWYKSPNYTHPKLKFYFFSKKDWSDKLG